MTTRAITVHLPEEAVKELEQTADMRRLKLDDVLAHLIEESLRRERPAKAVEKRLGRVAELTTAYLAGRLERKGSIAAEEPRLRFAGSGGAGGWGVGVIFVRNLTQLRAYDQRAPAEK